MKAILLAAGLGKRMRPLTDVTPKPLLKLGSRALIEYALEKLARADIRDVIINVHHLGDRIMETLGNGHRYGINISYSQEKERLETAGGIHRVLPFFEGKPFIVMSADIWTDYDLNQLLQTLPFDAHLVIVNNPPFHPEGDYGLDKNHTLTLSAPKLTYANISVLHPRIFDSFEGGYARLAPFLDKAIKAGRVTGEHYTGRWENLTSPDHLQALNQQWFKA